jgi:hypothetical protein
MEPALSHETGDDHGLLPESRHGHDETNLAEFPLVLLTKRPPDGRHTIEYHDRELHPRTGAPVERKVTITGAGKYGLPTTHDEDVLVGMIYLTLTDKSVKGFDDATVYFHRRQLLQILNWPDTGPYYERLKKSFRRWKGVTVVYENWWDPLAQDYVPEVGFSLLDNYQFGDARRRAASHLSLPLGDQHQPRAMCSITWNKTLFASFKNGYLNGYLTTLDLDKFFSLPTAAAKRAYRYLNLRLRASGHQDFDLQAFACQHVGFSPFYKPSRLRSEVQESIVEPLEKHDFIEPMPPKRRFLKHNGRDRVIFARKQPPALSSVESSTPDALLAAPAAARALLAELKRRGLGGKLAAEFAAQHPAEYLEHKLDYLDFMLGASPPKNPGGWLRAAIEQDYGPPPGYVSREERERQKQEAEAQRHQQQQVELDRRQQQQAELCKKAASQRAEAAIARLSTDERQALEAELYAQADASTRQMCDHPPTPSFRDTLMHRMLLKHFMAAEQA